MKEMFTLKEIEKIYKRKYPFVNYDRLNYWCARGYLKFEPLNEGEFEGKHGSPRYVRKDVIEAYLEQKKPFYKK